MRLTIYTIAHTMPLIPMMIGGIFLSSRQRRHMLFWLAAYVDRTTRGLHERIADELDSMAGLGR